MRYEVIATWDGGSEHREEYEVGLPISAAALMRIDCWDKGWNPPDHIEVKPLLTSGEEHPIS